MPTFHKCLLLKVDTRSFWLVIPNANFVILGSGAVTEEPGPQLHSMVSPELYFKNEYDFNRNILLLVIFDVPLN